MKKLFTSFVAAIALAVCGVATAQTAVTVFDAKDVPAGADLTTGTTTITSSTWYGGGSASVDNGATIDGVTWTKRLKFGGSSTFQSGKTLVRVLSFNATSNGIVTVYCGGGGGGTRTTYISQSMTGTNRDASTAVGSFASVDQARGVATATVSAGTVYIWADNNVAVYGITFLSTGGATLCGTPVITIGETWDEANNGFPVTLSCETEGAVLSYKVNGKDSTAYTSTFYVGSKAVVTAYAGGDGFVTANANATAPLHVINQVVAGNVFAFAAGDTVFEGLNIVTDNVEMMIHDNDWQNNAKALADGSAPAGYTALVAGNTNPVVSGNKPTAGCFYSFEVSAAGTLKVAAKMGKNKKFNVSDGTDLMPFEVNGATIQSNTVVDANNDTFGFMQFEVAADGTYYVWGSGTKIGIYGFEFAPAGAPTAIENVEAVEAIKIVRNGQVVIIRNGIEYNVLGAQL